MKRIQERKTQIGNKRATFVDKNRGNDLMAAIIEMPDDQIAILDENDEEKMKELIYAFKEKHEAEKLA